MINSVENFFEGPWHQVGNDFLDLTPKAQVTKAKVSGTISNSEAKETKMKRQSTEWEKMLTNHMSGKGLISKIPKELLQLNSQKKKKRSN